MLIRNTAFSNLKPESWIEFESLCLEVAKKKWGNYKSAYLYGRNGQKQDGVDIFVEFDSYTYGIQCKDVEDFTWSKIEKELKKVKDSDFKLNKYIIMTSSLRDTKIQKNMLKYNNENTDKIHLEILFWEDIEKYVVNDVELLETYLSVLSTNESITKKDKDIKLMEYIFSKISLDKLKESIELAPNSFDVYFSRVSDFVVDITNTPSFCIYDKELYAIFSGFVYYFNQIVDGYKNCYEEGLNGFMEYRMDSEYCMGFYGRIMDDLDEFKNILYKLAKFINEKYAEDIDLCALDSRARSYYEQNPY